MFADARPIRAPLDAAVHQPRGIKCAAGCFAQNGLEETNPVKLRTCGLRESRRHGERHSCFERIPILGKAASADLIQIKIGFCQPEKIENKNAFGCAGC
jgi:hypothetical protein